MISYEWSRDVPEYHGADLARLITETVAYDAEAGFSTADPNRPALPTARVHHLVVTMAPRGERGSPDLDRLPDVGVVAYLRIDLTDDIGYASLVVHHEFRSLGVATLLMERLTTEPQGFASIAGLNSLQAWSHSTHPAAERISWRFGASVRREIYKTLRLIGGRNPYNPVVVANIDKGAAGPVGEFAFAHGLGIAPADQETRDRAEVRLTFGDDPDRLGSVVVGSGVDGESAAPGLVELQLADGADPDHIRTALQTGLLQAQTTAARLACLYVDAGDEATLRVSREIEFFHDQTDRLFVLPLT